MATLTTEIPDAVADALAEHVAAMTASDAQKVVAGALALWLLQTGYSGVGLRQAYLDAAFPRRGRSGAGAA